MPAHSHGTAAGEDTAQPVEDNALLIATGASLSLRLHQAGKRTYTSKLSIMLGTQAKKSPLGLFSGLIPRRRASVGVGPSWPVWTPDVHAIITLESAILTIFRFAVHGRTLRFLTTFSDHPDGHESFFPNNRRCSRFSSARSSASEGSTSR